MIATNFATNSKISKTYRYSQILNSLDGSPTWRGSLDSVAFDPVGIKTKLLNLTQPCYAVKVGDKIGIANEGNISYASNGNTEQVKLLMSMLPISLEQLGARSFLTFHGVKYAYAAGAMAGGIASEELVITLGKANILSSFGSGGLSLNRIERTIEQIQQALPQGAYAFNLLHNPHDQAIERETVDLYLRHQVRTVEASAFLLEFRLNLLNAIAKPLSRQRLNN